MAASSEDLERIGEALAAAAAAIGALSAAGRRMEEKATGGLVTDADHAANAAIMALLPRDGEGWLSEESVDDPGRLQRRRVWIVDPLDGTQEFVAGIPEWCISIALVEDGEAIAGGISNPATGEVFLGAVGRGVTLNGRPVRVRTCRSLGEADVLASRSEVRRGEWEGCGSHFPMRAVGSVAYKLALVAAGLADATWTLVGKHEWDVAAGVALVLAAGGDVRTLSWEAPRFNRADCLLDGLVATGDGLEPAVKRFLGARLRAG